MSCLKCGESRYWEPTNGCMICNRTKKIDEVLSRLSGDPETFREILTNKDKLLEKLCNYAAWKGKQQGVPPWSIVGEILGHGSGVSSAIYELYRKQPECDGMGVPKS